MPVFFCTGDLEIGEYRWYSDGCINEIAHVPLFPVSFIQSSTYCFSPLLLHVRRTTSSLFCCIMKTASGLGRLDAKIKQSLFGFSILSLCYRRVKLIIKNQEQQQKNGAEFVWEPICTSSPSVYPWKKFYLDKNKFIKDFSFSLGAVGFSDCCRF